MIKKYGVSNTWALASTKDKIKSTMLNKYGVEHHSKNAGIMMKIRESMLSTKGFRNNFPDQYSNLTDDELFNVLFKSGKVKHIHEAALELNITYTSARVLFSKYAIERKYGPYSIEETNFKNMIESSFEVTTSSGDRKMLDGKEIDIWIPESNLGIEYHGLYWHSGESNRHVEKAKAATSKGINLLQFWSSELRAKEDVVMSIISSKLGKNTVIFARRCVIRELSSAEYRDFCNENHLQGASNASVRIGLYFEDELVSLMSFAKSRFSKSVEWEMIRFCSKRFVTVTGGASRLWKYFLKTHLPNSVVTYADARISNGSFYTKMGFKFSHHSSPNYWYTKDFRTLESRVKYQKHKLSGLLDTYDDDKSEKDNMIDAGFHIISDAGNLVYKWRKTDEGD